TVNVLADNDADLDAITLGGTAAGNFSLGGSISINEIGGTLEARVMGNATVNASTKLRVAADDDTLIVAVSGQATITTGSGAAIGAAVSKNLISRSVFATLNGPTVTSPTVELAAFSNGDIDAFAVGGSGAQNFALGGSVVLNAFTVTVECRILGGSTVTANTALTLTALEDSTIRALSGAVAIANQAAIGAAVATNDIANTVRTSIANGNLAKNITVGSLTMSATSDSTITIITVGGSGAGTFAAGGAVALNDISNTVDSHVSSNSRVILNGAMTATANDTPLIQALSGGIAVAGTAAIGASLATNDIGGTTATSISGSTFTGSGSIAMTSTSNPEIESLTVGGSGAGTFAAGGAVSLNDIHHTTDSHISGNANIGINGSITAKATDGSNIKGLAGAVAGAGGGAIGASIATNNIGNTITAYVSGSTVDSN
ncbi:MAG TPA: hypothetical protein PLV92_25620, partial [Pirellulaceae bacterium]|nr:hypothetical protein [Pirellulaceae bacterium]